MVVRRFDFEGMRKKTAKEKYETGAPNFSNSSFAMPTSMASPRLSTRRFGVRKPAQV